MFLTSISPLMTPSFMTKLLRMTLRASTFFLKVSLQLHGCANLIRIRNAASDRLYATALLELDELTESQMIRTVVKANPASSAKETFLVLRLVCGVPVPVDDDGHPATTVPCVSVVDRRHDRALFTLSRALLISTDAKRCHEVGTGVTRGQ